MIEIAVLGATGRTGIHVVKQALEKGHKVKALVRKAGKLADIENENLSIVEVDIFSAESLEPQLKGCQAVISALGFRRAEAGSK